MSEPGDPKDDSVPVPVGILPTSRSFYAAFAGPGWSGATGFPALSAESALEAKVLAETGALIDAPPPVLFHTGTGVAVAHASPRGVSVTRLDRDRSQIAFSGASAFAVAPGRRRSRLFGIDGHGLSTVVYEAKKGCSEDQRWLTHAGKRPLIAAARAGDAEIAFAAWEGEPALYVVLEIDGKPRVVRHELASECVGLGAVGAGNRAGVAVALAGTDHVEVAIADVRGVLVERMHTCLEGRGARWRHPQVLWIEDAFHVVAVDEREQRTVIATFSDGTIRGDITGASGQFAAAYYEKALYVARGEIDEATDRAAIVGYRMSLTQSTATRPFTLPVAPPRALWRARAAIRAEQVIRATHDALDTGARGYRGVMETAPPSTLTDDPCQLRIEPMHASFGAVLLGVRPCDVPHAGEAIGYDVTLLALAQGASGEPQPEGSFDRLARWVRAKVSKRAWALALREQAWIEEVAARLGGHAYWDRDPNGLRLVVHLERTPSAEKLAAWCVRVLGELAARAWERASLPPSAS